MARRAYQVSDWNGRSGESWVVHQERLDRMLADFGDAAIAAAGPACGESVLDIGCGAGASSFALASRVGRQGRVVGVDISEALIGAARAGAPAGDAVQFAVADAARLPLSGTAFDLLFSRFGVMFFENPAAAFAHLRQALKPSGRLAFVCWRTAAENDWVRLPMAAIRDLVPPVAAPDPEAPGPFSFGDRSRLEAILDRAGFVDIAVTAFDREIIFGVGVDDAAAVADALDMASEVGPLSRALEGCRDDVRATAKEAVRLAFAKRVRHGSVVIDGAAWIVTARAAR